MNLKDNYNGALQQPVHSGFSAKSTVHDVTGGISLKNKIAIVTGGYAGIGLESQLSTNHLGHFQPTAKLWPALKKANAARVINVSSYGHFGYPPNVLLTKTD